MYSRWKFRPRARHKLLKWSAVAAALAAGSVEDVLVRVDFVVELEALVARAAAGPEAPAGRWPGAAVRRRLSPGINPMDCLRSTPLMLSERSELGATSAASMVVLAGKNKIIIIKKIAA